MSIPNHPQHPVDADDPRVADPEEPAAIKVPAKMVDALPDSLLVLPITERPFFPAQAMPLMVDANMWGETLERVHHTPHKLIGLTLTREEPIHDSDAPPPVEALHEVGTVVRIHHASRVDDKIQFIAEGIERFKKVSWMSERTPYTALVEYPRQQHTGTQEIRAYALAIINKIKELLPLNPLYKEQLRGFLERFSPDEASPLTDFAAALTSAGRDELQEILATVPLLRRMEKTLLLVQRELEVAGLQAEIRERVETRISENQREFFLREQLKEIQKQLGISKDDKTVDIEQFRARLEGLTLPEAAQKRIDDEIEKFSYLEPGSPEYGLTRNYLDVLTDLPWGRLSEDRFDLDAARRILDRDHAGLEDVKERIIEFLAVAGFRKQVGGSIVLLVGPPGVGKTSIGRSIATALGREFYRFSVGGMRDEAEIKGHRRTYIGAMPGKFIQAMQHTGTANPVIMLDEIDKIGGAYHGDPASALLEVLDPEQNAAFLDHYLDVRFDLSKVLFVATANQLDTIPRPLLDRMEVIRLSGYVSEEKVAIARKHLLPKQREKAGLTARQLKMGTATLRSIVGDYAREAGVRNLEKQIGRIARKVVVEIASGKTDAVTVQPEDLKRYLGQPAFRDALPDSGIGVVTGLAWTALGGATLNVEATRVHAQQRGFKLTGQLGDVMRESAEIAYSYITSHLGDYGAVETFFDKAMLHIHVPEGATPKDGPSAGITMATALLSLALGRAPKRGFAMTGELTLTGRVLAVGGIREKLVAARREGIRQVILPKANQADFEELPAHVSKGMRVYWAETYADVAEQLFGGIQASAGGARGSASRIAKSASK